MVTDEPNWRRIKHIHVAVGADYKILVLFLFNSTYVLLFYELPLNWSPTQHTSFGRYHVVAAAMSLNQLAPSRRKAFRLTEYLKG